MAAISDERTGRVLPSAERLCAAIRGHHIGPHRLTRLAAALGRFHQHGPPDCAPRCRRGIRESVLAIDVWVAENLPPPRADARLHTEGVGAVIDRLARAQVDVYHLLMTVDDVTDPRVHAAWYRLAQLVDAYTDLNTGLSRRSLRLPTTATAGVFLSPVRCRWRQDGWSR